MTDRDLHRVLRLLVSGGVLERSEAERIDDRSVKERVHPLHVAYELGFDEDAIADYLAELMNAPRLHIARVWEGASDLLPEDLATKHECVPVRLLDDGRLLIAVIDPTDPEVVDDVTFVTGLSIVTQTVSTSDLFTLQVQAYHDETGHWRLRDLEFIMEDSFFDRGDRVDKIAGLVFLDCFKTEESITITKSPGRATIGDFADVTRGGTGYEVVGELVRHIRAMTGIPAGTGGLGGVYLIFGETVETFFFVEHTPDDRTTDITPVSDREFFQIFERPRF
jgi:hypothetical protein